MVYPESHYQSTGASPVSAIAREPNDTPQNTVRGNRHGSPERSWVVLPLGSECYTIEAEDGGMGIAGRPWATGNLWNGLVAQREEGEQV